MYERDLIEALVRTYDLKPPVDVDRVCRGEGIDVSEGTLPDGTFAIYYGEIRRFPLIIVRSGISEARRRQVIAHELAHHFFDEGGLYNFTEHYRSKKDRLAERFAAHLLVTDDEITAFMCEHPRLGDRYAAVHFGVELPFLAERMRLFRNDSAIRSLY